MELILENVRCFVKRQQVPIRPLTLLVGENSSGKSTFLGMLAIVLQSNNFPLRPNFNNDPYLFGNFSSIVSARPQGGNQANSFTIGLVRPTKLFDIQTTASFVENKDRIALHTIFLSNRRVSLSIEFLENKTIFSYSSNGRITREPFVITEEIGINKILARHSDIFSILISFLSAHHEKLEGYPNADAFYDFLDHQQTLSKSIAPIRTTPLRTYDALSEFETPSGAHIPLVLRRVFSSKSANALSIIAALHDFGKHSGLFTRFMVKMLGKSNNDPFQLKLRTGGPISNLTDVGYGVSQALPILVDSLIAEKGKNILMQQPEVHLHPKAQAALGTFFVEQVANKKKNFVIETHSDYILDRIRQEVAKKNIKKEDVAILFFDKVGHETTIHEIKLDDLGNIISAPDSYRKFFLEEEMNLLSRGRHQ